MRLTLGVILVVAAAACGGGSNASQANASTGASAAAAGPLDACTLLNEDEVSQIVGNAVAKGEHFAGSEVCKWNAEAPNTTVLLTVRPAGSIRERALCPDLGKSGEGQRLDGIADVAIWKFSNTIGLFNSGDLEACGKKGYLSLSLNGRQDETKLKDATAAIARKVLQRL
jgi:hypothetical protein